MQASENTINDSKDRTGLKNSTGQHFLEEKKKRFLKVAEVHRMPDFLMNLVTPEDQWMYITSSGALTAGRRNADYALFPYYTQDKLIDLAETTGSFTSIWKQGSSSPESLNWQPFSKNRETFDHLERNLYKSPEGDQVIFEEVNTLLGLQFSYLWTFSPRYGFARYAELTNTGSERAEIHLLDGLQNLVPYGFDQAFLNRFSNLADAYKKSELLTPQNLGIFYLSSIPTDRAEPSEGLLATVAWSLNYDPGKLLLSSSQIEAFQNQKALSTEYDIRGQRCACLLEKNLELDPGQRFQGWLVADINHDAGAIEALREELNNPARLTESLMQDIDRGKRSLRRKIGAADGYQLSNDPQRCSRHLANVLFNIMRGGVFYDNYEIPREDFLLHLQKSNKILYSQFRDVLAELPPLIHFQDLVSTVMNHPDPDLLRITLEYLPLIFSRRHGDPSRPWNAFSIDTTDAEGNPILAYQGNWRDIFQNWEALAWSFPQFLTGMIFRFLNASTADGYNPYRLTKNGFDWEILEPNEPWSNIGYWGDHQIIYLLKLLELSARLNAAELKSYLNEALFVYANVPYRIADFTDTWENPRATVAFDEVAHGILEQKVSELGSDGKLVTNQEGNLVKVSLVEKLLVPLLSKLSNLVPEGGIWMNTQRPEWNDANNALVGNGLSVVTLGYIHRYLEFLDSFFSDQTLPGECEVTEPVHELFAGIQAILSKYSDKLAGTLRDSDRYTITRELGEAGSAFRRKVYAGNHWTKRQVLSPDQVRIFAQLCKSWISHSLEANRREDGLYHAYNLMRQGPESIGIEYLYEMLEGQVSILSSQYLEAQEALDLLDTLKKSKLYAEARNSYLLYPDRELPRFLEKGTIADPLVRDSKVLTHLLDSKNTRIAYRDIHGHARFNSAFRNVENLKRALDSIRDEILSDFSDSDIHQVESIYETTFNHHAFTGRSGTFFAYEGLGSIYWHMVSKLLLAIQENYHAASHSKAGNEIPRRLADHYFDTLRGLGIYSDPADYGAFPSDPYSHTPKQCGAQQPGMTGQVKEDILVRWGELGIQINQGRLSFNPKLLRASEFLLQPARFSYESLQGAKSIVELGEMELAFTFCQVPIIYQKAEVAGLEIFLKDGSIQSSESNCLNKELSSSVFSREGEISLIRVKVPIKALQQ